ncbi:conserved oligomeric Golgi complex subunit 8 [Geosmithia morbida]|uniref:Mitochondrial glycine transporter n=1 Tax=Geosmithia morbida TaxID=1094350 RepID=A0A9P4YWL7_9HYPO|nr:conserved oligomeric Golgi complex subunit 8 [Geosmithia morbida]KAF4122384.1 conserved oligomeric Golgi complex subunit 8 [Geosmithia morbida]
MAESLKQFLDPQRTVTDSTAAEYLAHLADQPADSLRSSEPQRLAQSSHSLLLAVQGLSKKSHKPIVNSAAKHVSLRKSLPALAQSAAELSQAVPRLDSEAEHFSKTFGKAADSKLLARRKQALRLLQNSERLVDVMELPPLLTSAVMTTPVNYSSTLDLYAHVRRLASLYAESPLVASIMSEADDAIRQMASDLVTGLKAPNLKLAAALRTVGWLKRIIPDLVSGVAPEEALPALFLVCRMAAFVSLLEALEPLRKLADEEVVRLGKSPPSPFGGQQTERYLKRYIEIFREHSFNIASVFKNINASFSQPSVPDESDPLRPLPSAISSLPLHLVEMLLETLRHYLPTVKDQGTRESIVTQVLYCSGSLGRLGADFGMLLSTIGVDEWVDLVKRHRLLAGRLESVIGDYGRGQTPSFNMSQESTPSRSTKSGRHFVSGLGSGVSSAVILQPLDLLKTRMQQSGRSTLAQCLRDMRNSPAGLWASLWRGTVPSALRTGIGSALYFTSLNSIRQQIYTRNMLGQGGRVQTSSSVLPSLSNSANLLSGAAARTLAGFVLMPLTVIKVRFESNLYSYPTVWAAAKGIKQADGMRGFFSGFGATAMRDAPYAGSYVLFYEMLKPFVGSFAPQSLEEKSGHGEMQTSVSTAVNFTSASLAAAACSALSNPFDAVKTRIQLQPQKYRNMAQTTYLMIAEDGLRSLWDGLALRMSRKALSSALAWTLYEELIRRSGTS